MRKRALATGTFIVVALAFGGAFADDHPVGAAGKGLAKLMDWLADKALQTQITDALKDLEKAIREPLKAKKAKGVLVEVSVYKGSEGRKVLHGAFYLGDGDDPHKVYEDNAKKPKVRPAAPEGLLYDVDSSCLLWFTLDGEELKRGEIFGPIFQKWREKLLAGQK